MDRKLRFKTIEKNIFHQILDEIVEYAYQDAIKLGGYTQYFKNYKIESLVRDRRVTGAIEVAVAGLTDAELLSLSPSGTKNPTIAVAEVVMPLIRGVREVIESEEGANLIAQRVGNKFLRAV